MKNTPIDLMFSKGKYKDAGIFLKITQLLGILFVFTFITLILVTLTTNNNLTDIKSIKIAQLIQSICIFIIPPCVLAYMWSSKPLTYIQISQKINFKAVLLVIVFIIIAIPFINLLSYLNQQVIFPELLSPLENWMKASEAEIGVLTEKLLNVHTINDLAFNILLIAILPSLGEELFFRATIQKIFSEWRGAIFGIWVAAFIFSFIHLQFYGFFPRLLLGAFFGYLLWWSGSLWLPIIAHFTNNVIAVIFYYLKFNGVKVFDIDTIGTNETLYLGVISGVLTLGGVLLIKKKLSTEVKSDY